MTIKLSNHAAEAGEPCPCCNKKTRRATGVVQKNNEPWLGYGIFWVPGAPPEHPAGILLDFPAWEGEPLDGERVEVGLNFHGTGSPMGLFIADAPNGLSRAEVLGSDLLQPTIQVATTLWAQDPNIDELRKILPHPQVHKDAAGPQ